jgi:hypothetical protein
LLQVTISDGIFYFPENQIHRILSPDVFITKGVFKIHYPRSQTNVDFLVLETRHTLHVLTSYLIGKLKINDETSENIRSAHTTFVMMYRLCLG